MKNVNNIIFYLLPVFLVFLSGCDTITDIAKGIFGVGFWLGIIVMILLIVGVFFIVRKFM